jgi:hypothetical protein
MNSLAMLQQKFQESTSILELETKKLRALEAKYAEVCSEKTSMNEEVLGIQNSLKVIRLFRLLNCVSDSFLDR